MNVALLIVFAFLCASYSEVNHFYDSQIQYGCRRSALTWCSVPLSHGWNCSPEYLAEEIEERILMMTIKVALMEFVTISKDTSKYNLINMLFNALNIFVRVRICFSITSVTKASTST